MQMWIFQHSSDTTAAVAKDANAIKGSRMKAQG
jgi:hypothetical protein